MKIRKIKPDPDDMTLSIPSAILPGLNADKPSLSALNLVNCWKLREGQSAAKPVTNWKVQRLSTNPYNTGQ